MLPLANRNRPARPSQVHAGPPHQQEVGVAPGLLCLVADVVFLYRGTLDAVKGA